MQPDRIRTSHDLADLLEDAARGLRMLPPLDLSDAQRGIATNILKARKRGDSDQEARERLTLLAEELPELSRSDAETHLVSLTVESIRRLAPMLDVRIPSKATKNEYVQMLLTQLFDAPAGQELIRTFHKRGGRTGMPKSSSGSRGGRHMPGGKARNSDGENSDRGSHSATTIP